MALFNLENNKVLGMHNIFSDKENINEGILLKNPINEFLNDYIIIIYILFI